MKVGLITYHSAYNFGSVLQALATQRVLEDMGHSVTVINYRPETQKQFYAIVNTHNGLRRFIKSVLRLGNIRGLLKRKSRYEDFINSNLNLTDEFERPQDADKYADAFDLYISGSDQIWNKNSNELKNADWIYMDPYLLKFTSKKRISYASSLNDMSEDDLQKILKYIKSFHSLSCREKEACERLENLTGMKVCNVVDPTLLIYGTEWIKGMDNRRIVEKEYVLYYTLRGISDVLEDLSLLKMKYDNIVVIAPLSPIPPLKQIINMDSAGPIEFLKLIRDAKCIITTSYHGTLFSINMHKLFFSIKGRNRNSNKRFEDILSKTGLENRLINSIVEVNEDSIDYENVERKLNNYRSYSIEYLKNSFEG